jgi:DNA-binding transcriptional ArsR family regulator
VEVVGCGEFGSVLAGLLTFNSLVEYHARMPITAERRLDTVFSALGDPVRLAIVEHLSDHALGPATVNDLASLFPISLQAVSKHIKVLEAAGVVAQGRDGRRRPVSLVPAGFTTASEWFDVRCRQLEARYARLDHLLADLHEGTQP